ncbi:MAG: heavy-metal-associated domain-containing protein [Chloroflexi bacterium]|nr:heavy-metal-associated domain-containing protein [Chloroflexota bacterium]
MSIEAKVLRVTGEQTMHCGGCARSVQFALHQLPGVQQVDADYHTQEIRVVMDSAAVTVKQLQSQLDWIGYQVQPA